MCCGQGGHFWSDAGWTVGGPVFISRGGVGQGRESHDSQPPAESVDQLQSCSLSGAVRRWEEERKETREGEEHRKATERWSVVVPEGEGWMTQALGLCNQKEGERQRHSTRKK